MTTYNTKVYRDNDALVVASGGTLQVDSGATFTVGGAEVSLAAAGLVADEVAYLVGVTAGTVTASKALVVDSNKDLSTLRNVAAVAITAGVNGGSGSAGSFVINNGANPGSSASLGYADLVQIDGLTAGTVTASKAVVVDANKDIGDFRNVKLLGLDFENGGTDITFRIVGGKLIVTGLPTSDPTTAGALWSNSGVLTLSAGS